MVHPVVGTALFLAAVAIPLPQAGFQRKESAYPFILVPSDALRGHLMDGPFREPGDVFFEPAASELYVVDTKNALIGIFDTDGTPLFAFGQRPVLVDPTEVHVTPEGTIFVLDGSQREIKPFTYRGEVLQPIGFPYPAIGERSGGIARIGAFTIDRQGRWYVGDLDSNRVLVYDADRKFQFAIPDEEGLVSLSIVSGIGVSDEGLIAVVHMGETPVLVFDESGRFVSGFGTRDLGADSFTAPSDVAFDEEGRLFVVDMLRHDVRIFDLAGNVLGLFGGWFGPETGGRAPGEMLYPTAITIVPDGPVYVAERFGNRVQKFKRLPVGEDPGRPQLRIPDVTGDD